MALRVCWVVFAGARPSPCNATLHAAFVCTALAAWMRTATAHPRPKLGLTFPTRAARKNSTTAISAQPGPAPGVNVTRVAVDCLHARHQRPVCEETVESIAGCWEHHQAQSGSAPSTTTWSRLSLLNIEKYEGRGVLAGVNNKF